jgi:hypothetical protein
MMARTASPKPEQVLADSKPTLDTFAKRTGFTPNMMATFALSPIAFNGEQRARNGRAARAASRRHARDGADVRAVRQ